MKFNITAILLLYLFVSCNKETQNAVIGIEPERCNTKINFLNYVNDIEFIPFDKDVIVDNALAQLVITDSLFVFTTYSYNRIYFISQDSLKISNISKYGKDVPVRVGETFSIAYSKEDQELYVSDREARIFTYSLNEKEYKSVKTGLLGYQMVYFRNKLIILNQDFENGILKIVNPKSWKIEKEYLKISMD